MSYALKIAEPDDIEPYFESFLQNDHAKLIELEQKYCQLMGSMRQTQENLRNGIAKNKRKLGDMEIAIKRLKLNHHDLENSDIYKSVTKKISEMSNQYKDYKLGLPKKPNWFLAKCIGDLDISLYWKKYDYKESYETLKMNASVLFLIIWTINFFLIPFRTFDTIHNSFVLWYYSSLTIQEHILVANGSRIKLWWRLHHYISIFGAGVVMVWPNSQSYQLYRPYYYAYAAFQAFVHIMQYSYQKQILYRFRAMGLSSSMTLTVDGCRPFMWNEFTALIFILGILYVFQAFHVYILLKIWKGTTKTEIYPLILSTIFAFVFAGNTISVVSILTSKLKRTKEE